MEGVFEAIWAAVTFLSEVIAAIVIWLCEGIYLCIYYSFHPHTNYQEYLF